MDHSLTVYYVFFGVVAFVVGAVVGSFLNVVIYRLPLDLSVNEPKRSFCPFCKNQIPWHQNLPLLSWMFLRGRCAHCRARIAFRYFAVELLTALLFLAIWRAFPFDVAIAYWIFVSLLVAATFIDFEHFIIPDEITLGGTAAGVIACAIVPTLMATAHRGRAVLTSAASAALGYVLLWLVLEAGKKVFGKKRVNLDGPTLFTWTRKDDDADFVVGEEKGLWSDYFSRETDQLILHCDEAIVGERNLGAADLRFHYNRVNFGTDELALDTLDRISG